MYRTNEAVMCKLRNLLTVILVVIFITVVALADDNPQTDLRMLEKVTIDCVGARLQSTVEKVSAAAGVKVTSGRDVNDWIVRDIPVLVCSRDLPLGVLLRGMADTNHLLLSRNKTDDTFSYHIWRDLKRERELAEFEEKRYVAAIAAASWDWDAFSRIKDLPEEAFSSDPDKVHNYGKLRGISNTLADLNPKIKDRVLSGEEIKLQMRLPDAVRPSFRQVLDSAWDERKQNDTKKYGKLNIPEDAKEEIGQGEMHLSFGTGVGDPEGLVIRVFTFPQEEDVDHSQFQPLLQKYLHDLPSRPEVPVMKLKTDELEGRYTRLSLKSAEGPEILDTKVKIPLPTDMKKPLCSDVLCGLSKATGYSIVAEGYAIREPSMMWGGPKDFSNEFDRETTARNVLKIAENQVWYLDEKNKLIIGHDKDWLHKTKSLVPDKLLKDLRDKLSGPGFEFDDLEMLAGLTETQVDYWIVCCLEYPEVSVLRRVVSSASGDDAVLKLYFSLSKSDRARVLSGRQMSLANCDPVLLQKVLHWYEPEDKPLPEAYLRITKDGEGYRVYIEEKDAKIPLGRGDVRGEFPMHSEARRAELEKR